MLDPVKLRTHMDLPKNSRRAAKQRIAWRLAKITASFAAIGNEKMRLIDLYAAGQMPKDEYVAANVALDERLEELKREKIALSRKQSLNDDESLDLRLRQFCETVKARFERCVDFDTKRQFLLDHVGKVIFFRDKVTLVGSVPIELKEEGQLTAGRKVAFRIEGKIDRAEVRRRPKPRKKAVQGGLVKGWQAQMTVSALGAAHDAV
jgi:hypothetical protein